MFFTKIFLLFAHFIVLMMFRHLACILLYFMFRLGLNTYHYTWWSNFKSLYLNVRVVACVRKCRYMHGSLNSMDSGLVFNTVLHLIRADFIITWQACILSWNCHSSWIEVIPVLDKWQMESRSLILMVCNMHVDKNTKSQTQWWWPVPAQAI